MKYFFYNEFCTWNTHGNLLMKIMYEDLDSRFSFLKNIEDSEEFVTELLGLSKLATDPDMTVIEPSFIKFCKEQNLDLDIDDHMSEIMDMLLALVSNQVSYHRLCRTSKIRQRSKGEAGRI
ncbi:hypothetical protein ASwh1_51 [Aeromonas phage Aswh_1]|nr:hypothetical protein ASwh1_51 [Aeromonas phage Aswh_1]